MVEHVSDVSPDLDSFLRIENQVRTVSLLQRVHRIIDGESVVQENCDLKENIETSQNEVRLSMNL